MATTVVMLKPRSELRLDSCCEVQIPNETIRTPPIYGAHLVSEDLKKAHPKATHRTGPSSKFNCHGLVFASRRTRIWDSAVVARVLREDAYTKIPEAQVLPGDIAVYFDEGDLTHSGVVVDGPKPGFVMPQILGKWGDAQEVVHSAYDVPQGYGKTIEYYRIG